MDMDNDIGFPRSNAGPTRLPRVERTPVPKTRMVGTSLGMAQDSEDFAASG
jgi:hypothetical protein